MKQASRSRLRERGDSRLGEANPTEAWTLDVVREDLIEELGHALVPDGATFAGPLVRGAVGIARRPDSGKTREATAEALFRVECR